MHPAVVVVAATDATTAWAVAVVRGDSGENAAPCPCQRPQDCAAESFVGHRQLTRRASSCFDNPRNGIWDRKSSTRKSIDNTISNN
jgi:hypothetical protein